MSCNVLKVNLSGKTIGMLSEVAPSEARTRLDSLTKCMDFFMKCANVAFSVVPGIGETEFEFDMVFCLGICLELIMTIMHVQPKLLFFSFLIFIRHHP